MALSRASRLAYYKENPHLIPEEVHGSIYGYQYFGCRCDSCRGTWNTYSRDLRRKRLERKDEIPESAHGTDGGYTNWNCRCDRCKAAAADRHFRNVVVPKLKAKKEKVPFRLTAPMQDMIASAREAFLADIEYSIAVAKQSGRAWGRLPENRDRDE